MPPPIGGAQLSSRGARAPPCPPPLAPPLRSSKEDSTCKSIELSKLALDSITNRIFTLNRAANNILVFQQDGTLIACFGEEFKNLTDLCIDNDNKFFYVLDRQNCVYKFNLTTYQLLRKRENDILR